MDFDDEYEFEDKQFMGRDTQCKHGLWEHENCKQCHTIPEVAPRASSDELLVRIAELAHCGGREGLSESGALREIRIITLPWFDKMCNKKHATKGEGR